MRGGRDLIPTRMWKGSSFSTAGIRRTNTQPRYQNTKQHFLFCGLCTDCCSGLQLLRQRRHYKSTPSLHDPAPLMEMDDPSLPLILSSPSSPSSVPPALSPLIPVPFSHPPLPMSHLDLTLTHAHTQTHTHTQPPTHPSHRFSSTPLISPLTKTLPLTSAGLISDGEMWQEEEWTGERRKVEVSDDPWRDVPLSACLALQHCFPAFLLDFALPLQNSAFSLSTSGWLPRLTFPHANLDFVPARCSLCREWTGLSERRREWK